MTRFLQLCRSSSGRHVSGLFRGPCSSPRAWHRWCRRNLPPPPHASGTSPPRTLRPHTGNTGRDTLNFLKFVCLCFTVHNKDSNDRGVECNKDFQPESNQERLQVTGKRSSKCDQKYLTKCLNLLLRINPSWQKHDLRHRDNIGRVKIVWLVASRNSQTQKKIGVKDIKKYSKCPP